MIRRDFLAGIGLLTVFGPRQSWAVAKDPLPAEGVDITYRVTFGDSDIGTQKVSIRQHDKAGHVVVDYRTKLEVRVLFAVAYALDHRSTEVWDGFTLRSVKSVTVENGEKTLVEGDVSEKGLRIRKAGTEATLPPNAVTTDSFWVAAATDSPSVVNTRTGDIAVPELEALGDGGWRFKANFAHGPVVATMRYDGDFLAEAEIDDDGHTVRLVRTTA